ncbi:delta-like protein 1 [Ornithodoros turicata]|uniref:delta-like protein 1 n=1 Tax=Ornithodoros turicata TaxID=34597 RepID=UPI003138905E
MDDILVASPSPEAHRAHLRALFSRLEDYGVSINAANGGLLRCTLFRAFRKEARRPLLNKFRSLGASEWFLDLATRVLDIPERWIQRRVAFDDRSNRVSEGALVQRFTLKRQLGVVWNWQHWTFERDSPRAHVDVDYRVLCSPGFTGANCSEECPGPDAVNPRFTCLPDGAKECNAGWSGEECDVPVCADGCHPDHGFCDKPGECRCRMGWEGPLCDRCVTMPGCVHGSCNATFECNCEPGWDGFFCNRPMCGDGCHPTRGYCERPGQCSCRFGWQGERCDSCKPLPGCVHGSCHKPLECVCEEGWMGIFCHIPVCSSKCHFEHGYCTKPDECRCRIGWTGKNCDKCFPYPGCRHGACTKPWECMCEPGWGGTLCDQELKYCEEHAPCENGSTCLSLSEEDGFYRCVCPDDLSGRNCTVPVTPSDIFLISRNRIAGEIF